MKFIKIEGKINTRAVILEETTESIYAIDESGNFFNFKKQNKLFKITDINVEPSDELQNKVNNFLSIKNKIRDLNNQSKNLLNCIREELNKSFNNFSNNAFLLKDILENLTLNGRINLSYILSENILTTDGISIIFNKCIPIDCKDEFKELLQNCTLQNCKENISKFISENTSDFNDKCEEEDEVQSNSNFECDINKDILLDILKNYLPLIFQIKK